MKFIDKESEPNKITCKNYSNPVRRDVIENSFDIYYLSFIDSYLFSVTKREHCGIYE